jgi:hypothetical protein
MHAHQCVPPLPIKFTRNSRAGLQWATVDLMPDLAVPALHFTDRKYGLAGSKQPMVARLTTSTWIKRGPIENDSIVRRRDNLGFECLTVRILMI